MSQHDDPAEGIVAARQDGKKHLLLAASGSVATIKIPEIVQRLAYHSNLSIRIVLTESSQRFLAGQSQEQPALSAVQQLLNVDAVYGDEAEWARPWTRGAGILHIELRRWADILVVAPLSANTLAKIVNGLSDNLLLSCVRAWDTEGSIDGQRKRIVVCPAMNTAMWRHPITAKQLRVLKEDWGVQDASPSGPASSTAIGSEPSQTGWFEVVQPMSKTLACGDTGDGAMASVDEIAGRDPPQSTFLVCPC
ncbi:hypothetical protein P8C59_003186 [Phyllachora maydis]|uniref:Flavoprotein domain-containing protein n=1 Tax=Phyllachora maydis TaxID=1825666 RepID=A0AAD9MC59_9PEZI|nr:hypothetical protein P8C59_003186 [Phyllachora maydis]